MKSKLLWLSEFRGLNEMIDRKHNIKTRTREDDSFRVIFFTGCGLERIMFEELLTAFIKGSPDPMDIFEEIKKHYKRVLKSMKAESEDLATAVNDHLVEIEWLLEDGPQDDEDKIRDQMQSVQLLIGSRIAFHLLNLTGWNWADARDIFWVEEDYQRTGPSEEKVKTGLDQLFSENQIKLPVLTQGGLVGTDDNNSLVIKMNSLIEGAARELNIEMVRL
nr:hypothetical protein [Saprospiraceae bacterium]